MSVVIKLDENLIAEIDAAARNSKKNRLQYINESLRKSLREHSGKRKDGKQKHMEDEISRMYEEAYKKFPVQPDEFEIEDEQMEEFWKQV